MSQFCVELLKECNEIFYEAGMDLELIKKLNLDPNEDDEFEAKTDHDYILIIGDTWRYAQINRAYIQIYIDWYEKALKCEEIDNQDAEDDLISNLRDVLRSLINSKAQVGILKNLMEIKFR